METISQKQYEEYLSMYGKDTLLHFHVGRGGSFYNPGQITFEGIVSGIDSIPPFCNLFGQKDEEDNELPGEWEYKDECGNGVGLTNTEAKSGVGHIVFDTGYNEDYVIRLADCGEKEIDAILEFLTWESEYIIPALIEMGMIDEDLKKEFIEEY